MTKKEKLILSLLIKGKTKNEIAMLLGISRSGVDYHIKKLFNHYGVNTLYSLVGTQLSPLTELVQELEHQVQMLTDSKLTQTQCTYCGHKTAYAWTGK